MLFSSSRFFRPPAFPAAFAVGAELGRELPDARASSPSRRALSFAPNFVMGISGPTPHSTCPRPVAAKRCQNGRTNPNFLGFFLATVPAVVTMRHAHIIVLLLPILTRAYRCCTQAALCPPLPLENRSVLLIWVECPHAQLACRVTAARCSLTHANHSSFPRWFSRNISFGRKEAHAFFAKLAIFAGDTDVTEPRPVAAHAEHVSHLHVAAGHRLPRREDHGGGAPATAMILARLATHTPPNPK